MCQYTSRCPVGTHNPGTVCQYAAGRRRMYSIMLLMVLLLVAVLFFLWKQGTLTL